MFALTNRYRCFPWSHPHLGQQWGHNQMWAFLSGPINSSVSYLRWDWLGNVELHLRLSFYRGISCQINLAIGNSYFWTKLNGCQKVDIFQLKVTHLSTVFNWPILKKSGQLVELVSFWVHNVTLNKLRSSSPLKEGVVSVTATVHCERS